MIRWGIAGTGNVAHAFARALAEDSPSSMLDGELVAVGSRDAVRADAFAGEHSVGHAYAAYEGLMNCPDVDVVYIATPASHHYQHARMALEAGKHVLVEKPFTVTAAQAETLRGIADREALFLMEAAWCRFLPSWRRLRTLLDEHPIGDVRMVQAAFGGRADYRPELRPFRNDLAGGSLMDGGVYPVHLAHMILGAPSRVAAEGTTPIGESGVDVQNAMVFGYDDGCLASLTSGLTVTLDASARIYGTEGMIELPGNFTNPAYINVLYPGKQPSRYDFPPTRDRLGHQIEEVQRCIEAGYLESPIMPVAESVAVMSTLDRARESMGLRFPHEVEAL